MLEPKDKPKEKSVRTRPANVIRAIVLSAAAAAAPAASSTGCVGEPAYGVPEPDVSQEDAGGDGDVSADTYYGVPDGTDVAEMTPPYGVPEYGVPDAVEYYGVPDGSEESTPDYGVPDAAADGDPEAGLLYGAPEPPAK